MILYHFSSKMTTHEEDVTANRSDSHVSQNQDVGQRAKIDMTEAVEDILKRFQDHNQDSMKTIAASITRSFDGFKDVIMQLAQNRNTAVAVDSTGRTTDNTSVDQGVGGRNTASSVDPPASHLPLPQPPPTPMLPPSTAVAANVTNKDNVTPSRSGSSDRNSRRRNDDDSISLSSGASRDTSLSLHSGRRKRSRSKSRSRSRSRSGSKSRLRSKSKSRSASSSHGSKRSKHDEPPSPAEVRPLDGDQEFWSKQVENYQVDQKIGPEVSSALAGACKIFWAKEINADQLKELGESSKVPGNCSFLKVQSCNKEIFSSTSGDIRNKDFSLQTVLGTHSAMASSMIQAADLLYKLKEEFGNISKDLAGKFDPIMEKVKNALMFAGKTSIQINAHRREMFKPSLPASLKCIVDQPSEETSEYLFGDNLKDRVTKIKGDYSMRQEFVKKDEFRKKYPNSKTNSKSENYRGSSNTRARGASYSRGTNRYLSKDQKRNNSNRGRGKSQNNSNKSKFYQDRNQKESASRSPRE